jgi:hypothetical protein
MCSERMVWDVSSSNSASGKARMNQNIPGNSQLRKVLDFRLPRLGAHNLLRYAIHTLR